MRKNRVASEIEAEIAAQEEKTEKVKRPRRYAWAELLKRVFSVDALKCNHCGNTIGGIQNHNSGTAAVLLNKRKFFYIFHEFTH